MIRLHIIRTIIFAIIGFGIGYAILATSPKVFEGRVQMILGNQNSSQRFYPSQMQEDVAAILQSGLASNPLTEAQILKGEGVFRDALGKVAQNNGDAKMLEQFDDYYRMYDVQSSTDGSAAVVKARAYSSKDATLLANFIADSYNERRQANQKESISKAIDYLDAQIKFAQEDLKKADENLKQVKIDTGLTDPAGVVTRQVEYEQQLRAQVDGVKAEMAGVDKQIAETSAQVNALPDFEAGDNSEQKNQVLQQLQSQLAEQMRQRDQLLVEYYSDSVPVRLVQGSISAINKQITDIKSGKTVFEKTVVNQRPNVLKKTLQSTLASAQISKRGLEERLSKIQGNYDAQVAKVGEIPGSTLKLIEAARDEEIKDANFKRLRTQQEDLKNRRELVGRAAQIVYQATDDPNPVLPRPAVVYVVAVLGTAILGLLISFAVEAMRLRIYSSTQLQELTGLPVVGVVHDLPGPTARRLLTSVREPNPVISESYRFMAFAATTKKQEGPRKILLTGVDNNAGCSTTAAQFATALAQTGSRVLLVDCALEDPTITKVFGLEQKSGVSDILGQTQLPSGEPVGSDTATVNLRVLGAGTEAKNAIKVTPTQNIQAMLNALSASCDVVVIDSLPCLMSSDAARLVPHVDEVYLVTSAKTANMRNVAAAIDVLTLASAASIKFIVTKGSRGEEAVMRQAGLAIRA